MDLEELFNKLKNVNRTDTEWTEGDGDNDSSWRGGGGGGGQLRLPKLPKLPVIIVILLLAALFFASEIIDFYTDLLWYRSLEFDSVLWQRIITQAGLFVLVAVVTFVVYSLNWKMAYRIAQTEEMKAASDQKGMISPSLYIVLIAALFALLAGMSNYHHWQTLLQFIHAVPFGENDAIFGHDIAFYIFKLPMIQWLQGYLSSLVLFSLVGSVVVYMVLKAVRIDAGSVFLLRGARLHLFLLGALFVFLLGVRFWLSRYDLLFSSTGVVFGVGYTDFHVRLPALTILALATVVASLLLLANFFKPMWKVSAVILVLLFLGAAFVQGILPTLVQNYIVKPNEYEREKEFLGNHISATRRAFSLDDVRTFQMMPNPEVTMEEMRTDSETVENIRLWDYGPLLRTYKQLQEIRTYYDFSDIDIDRYNIDGKNRQVMLSIRELDSVQLQNRTWVNSHLEFTHGFGVVMNPVNEMEEGGLPVFFMKDLPPRSTVPIEIDKPQIYYGEKPSVYALVKTDVMEFDYPAGDSNVRSTYEGTGGVEIGSLFRRLLFAMKFRDSEILFTRSLKPESRILFNRNIIEAINKVAPFLILEGDTYPVIIDGRIIWLQDAYTASGSYPYSRPFYRPRGQQDLRDFYGVNYLRNSVKITVDAYDGDISFYVVDDSDPIIRNWMAVFPKLFKSADTVSEELRAHFRYPEEYFEVQSDVYRIYHMTDTNTFYNREDVWVTSPQGQDRMIRPNYVTMQLLDEKTPEFALIAPFMPLGRNNLIGWMAGRCDPKHYGELVVYQFPKQELIFGPSQIDALIDQNTEISSQLSLWSQRGSDVIRGDLLVIPVGKSLLYVQPLYMRAERGDLPELKRIILSTGGRVAWGETFDEAVYELFGQKRLEEPQKPAVSDQRPQEERQGQTDETPHDRGSLADLVQRARQHYERADEASRSGNWARYGQELKALESTLQELDRLVGSENTEDNTETDKEEQNMETGSIFNR